MMVLLVCLCNCRFFYKKYILRIFDSIYMSSLSLLGLNLKVIFFLMCLDKCILFLNCLEMCCFDKCFCEIIFWVIVYYKCNLKGCDVCKLLNEVRLFWDMYYEICECWKNLSLEILNYVNWKKYLKE